MADVILAASTTQIDSSIVTELVNLTKTMMGLFAEFPLNVILAGSLCFVALGLFRGARRSVG